MNTQSASTQRRSTNRIVVIAALAAVVIMSALMLLSIAVSNDALGRSIVDVVTGTTDEPSRCGMSQQTFVELPKQVQSDLTEQCNRPSDVRP